MPISLDKIKNLRRRKGGINIPEDESKYNAKVYIVDSENNTTEITEDIWGALSFDKLTLNNGISTASFALSNPDSIYDDLITEGNKIRVVEDYTDSTPTTELLEYYITEYPDSLNTSMAYFKNVSLSQLPFFESDNIHLRIDTPTNVDEVIKQAIDIYFSDFVTYSNLPTINYKIDGIFDGTAQRLFGSWLDDAGYDGYIDNDFDLHAVEKGKETHPSARAVFNYNLLNLDYGSRKINQKNKVTGLGKNNMIWTEYSSNREPWNKGLNISDSSLPSLATLKKKIIAKLAERQYNSKTGYFDINNGYTTLQPGQNIQVMIPKIENGLVRCTSISGYIDFNTAERFESLGVEENLTPAMSWLRQYITNVRRNTSKNDYGFTHCVHMDFIESPSVVLNKANVVEINGTLELAEGKNSGSCNSTVQSVDYNITKGQFFITGSNLSKSRLRISVDGAVTKHNVSDEQVLDFSGSDNKKAIVYLEPVEVSQTSRPIIKNVLFLFRGELG